MNARRALAELRNPPVSAGWIYAAFLIILATHVWLLFTRAINWDEFYYYSQIEQFRRGQLNTPLQTLHVHIFAWLPETRPTGVDDIILGRLFMLSCELITASSIAIIARRFTRNIPALLAALAYLSAGFVVENGFSFRTDPLAIALASCAMCVLLWNRLSLVQIAIFGVLVALAGMITMKTILLLPAFVGIAWLRWSEAKFSIKTAVHLIGASLSAAIFFALILQLHSNTFPELAAHAGQAAQQETIEDTQAMVSASSSKMFFLGMPAYLAYFKIFTLTALPLMIAVISVPFLLLRWNGNSIEKWALLGLFLPLTTIAFYHNALPYYYAFMMPPVAAAAGIAFSKALDRYDVKLILFLMVANAIAMTIASGPSRIDHQRDIQIAAEQIFKEPVNYFDFPAMLPTFRKVNIFMTRWGMEEYLAGGGPSYEAILEGQQVPLLLANDPIFNPSFLELLSGTPTQRFFRSEDAVALRDTYRQFWGPFWIAGVEVKSNSTRTWKVRVPGEYTVSENPISIDGKIVPIGAVISLERNEYNLVNAGNRSAVLTWGDNLKPPQAEPPPRPIWTDF